MAHAATKTKAEAEYQVLLAVLNFHRDYLHLHYAHAHIQMNDRLIQVILTPRQAIPAEERLAQSPEGQVQLQQMHAAAFHSGETLLREQIYSIVGIEVSTFSTHLDGKSGTNTVAIRLAKPLDDVFRPEPNHDTHRQPLAYPAKPR